MLNRSKILDRSNAIQVERLHIQASLADTNTELAVGAERLRRCLDLVADPVRLYADAPDETRRQLKGTFYERFYLDDEPVTVVRDELRPPFDEIREGEVAYWRYKELTMGRRRLQSESEQAGRTAERDRPERLDRSLRLGRLSYRKQPDRQEEPQQS